MINPNNGIYLEGKLTATGRAEDGIASILTDVRDATRTVESLRLTDMLFNFCNSPHKQWKKLLESSFAGV